MKTEIKVTLQMHLKNAQILHFVGRSRYPGGHPAMR